MDLSSDLNGVLSCSDFDLDVNVEDTFPSAFGEESNNEEEGDQEEHPFGIGIEQECDNEDQSSSHSQEKFGSCQEESELFHQDLEGFDSRSYSHESPQINDVKPSSMNTLSNTSSDIPHRGSLSRNIVGNNITYNLTILNTCDGSQYTLEYTPEHYDFLQDIFTILDNESNGLISRSDLQEFVMLRCPVFKRRDRAIAVYKEMNHNQELDVESFSDKSSFEQIWESVLTCATNFNEQKHLQCNMIGIEGWMLFAKFISLAQYYDAKSRFSARQLQSSSNENEGVKDELVLVEVPSTSEPPTELSVSNLIDCETSYLEKSRMYEKEYDDLEMKGLPLPELDLDHSYISIHDRPRKVENEVMGSNVNDKNIHSSSPFVTVQVFGSNSKTILYTNNEENLEFIITFYQAGKLTRPDQIVKVKRSFADLKWLHETFKSHCEVGGTLCGRIIPPFPSKYLSRADQLVSASLSNPSSSAVAVASAGVSASVEVVTNAATKTAKSLWGNIPGRKKISKYVKTAIKSQTKAPPTAALAMPKADYKKHDKEVHDTPESKARQIEKYLSYLLNHPALSTSFPLNLILKTSQSGLEVSKTLLGKGKESNIPSFLSYDENSFKVLSAFFKSFPNPNNAKNLSWVRSAAQAALIVKVHSLLETAGYQSKSTVLQHASLPQYSSVKDNDSSGNNSQNDDGEADLDENECKDGISELGDESNDEFEGFDVLPTPLPTSETSALCAGYRTPATVSDTKSYSTYTCSFQETKQRASLGEIDVERDIERLRDVLRRVDKCFSSCCSALVKINKNRKAKEQIHMGILQDMDNWIEMRGKIITQRALLEGVEKLELSQQSLEKDFYQFSEGMMWSAALAASAYNASKDVCQTIKAAQVASRAKATADCAVQNAVTAEKECIESGEALKAIQEKVATSKMQALHAAVVEHEAATAKKRAVISLANDVKHWNTQRKSEILQICRNTVKQQISSVRDNLQGWERLKEGLITSPNIFQDTTTHVPYPLHSPAVYSFKSEKSTIHAAASETPSHEKKEEDPEIAIEECTNGVESLTYEIQNDYFASSPSHDNSNSMPPSDELEDEIKNDDEESSLCSNALHTEDKSHDSHTDIEHFDSNDNSFFHSDKDGGENDMTESMQSLVDGLLNWGGNYEEDDSDLALPKGMAASLVLDEHHFGM